VYVVPTPFVPKYVFCSRWYCVCGGYCFRNTPGTSELGYQSCHSIEVFLPTPAKTCKYGSNRSVHACVCETNGYRPGVSNLRCHTTMYSRSARRSSPRSIDLPYSSKASSHPALERSIQFMGLGKVCKHHFFCVYNRRALVLVMRFVYLQVEGGLTSHTDLVKNSSIPRPTGLRKLSETPFATPMAPQQRKREDDLGGTT